MTVYIDSLLGDIHQNFSRVKPPFVVLLVNPWFRPTNSKSNLLRICITLYPPSSPSFFRFFTISLNYLSLSSGDALHPPCLDLPALAHNMASSDLRMRGETWCPGLSSLTSMERFRARTGTSLISGDIRLRFGSGADQTYFRLFS